MFFLTLCLLFIMHPSNPGMAIMHIAIDSKLLILSLHFLCADMFPCEDIEILSVCPYLEKKKITLASTMLVLQ